MSVSKQDYADAKQYQDHLMEQYKLYVEMADRISQRRMTTNTFFMSVNAFLVTLVTLFSDGNLLALIAVSLTGVIFSFAWYFLLENYKKLNSGKFKVVHDMEALLPYAPYDVEWDKLGRGKDKNLYWPLSHLERALPAVFGVLYVCFMAWLIYCLMTGTAISFPDAQIPEIDIA